MSENSEESKDPFVGPDMTQAALRRLEEMTERFRLLVERIDLGKYERSDFNYRGSAGKFFISDRTTKWSEEIYFIERELLHELAKFQKIFEYINTYEDFESDIAKYKYFIAKVRDAYSELSALDAIRQFPKAAISFLFAAIGTISSRYVSLIGKALADTPAFVPPLGLPQSVFTGMIIGFLVVVSLLVLAMTYVGFFAPRKSQAAASVVSHIVSFSAGIAVGLFKSS